MWVSAPGSTGSYLLGSSGTAPSLVVTGAEYDGYYGIGSTTQNSGSNNMTGSIGALYLGYQASPASGAYTLNGGSLSVNPTDSNGGSEYDGYATSGSFIQNGETHTTTGNLEIGYQAASKGSYVMNSAATGPTLTVNENEIIGDSATGNSSGGVITRYGGSFNQSGGAHTVQGNLTLGNSAGSSGAYILSGGTLQSSQGGLGVGNDYVGNNGIGYLMQTGGSNMDPGDLYIGNNSISSGTYILSGSNSVVLNVSGYEYVGQSATGNISGGAITRYGGVFNQSGGTHTVQTSLDVGDLTGSTGEFLLIGGILQVGPGFMGVTGESIGSDGTGNFIQTGGTNLDGGSLILGGDSPALGTYTLSGPTSSVLSVAGNELVGEAASGTYNGSTLIQYGGWFNQSGGTQTISGYLSIADFSGTGCFTLSGAASLQSNSILIGGEQGGGGFGAFNQTGGTNTVTTNVLIGAADLGRGVFNATGGITNIGGELDVGGGQIDVEDGGGGGTLNVGGQAVVNVVGDTVVFDALNCNVNLTGGSLTTANLVLEVGLSQFNWTGGTLHLTNGSINIQNSGLFGPSLTLSSGMTLIPDGGLNIAPGAVLNLAGGGLNISAGCVTSNRGTLNQSSGTVVINGLLENSGTANLNGLQSWGAGSVLVNLAGTLTLGTSLNPSGFGPVVAVSGGTLIVPAPQVFLSLSIAGGARTNVMIPGQDHALVTSALSFAGTIGSWVGQLDISHNDLIVHNGNIGQLTNQVSQGFNGGLWNGQGIISSAAAATNLNALGVILNTTGTSTPLYTSFDSIAVSSTDVLIKYTYYGDANLDGKVDGSDYSLIDFAYLSDKSHLGQYTGWYHGDFDYDGVVNGSDYTLIDNAYNSQGAALTTEVAKATEDIALDSTAGVPEPASMSLVGIGSLALLRRRHPNRARQAESQQLAS